MAAGGNWIDTAASYGQGRSETAVGWLLQASLTAWPRRVHGSFARIARLGPAFCLKIHINIRWRPELADTIS
jgi:hypothetical protein